MPTQDHRGAVWVNPYVYFCAEIGKKRKIVRFKLDTENPSTMTEEVIQTIGSVEDFCVNPDHTIFYLTKDSEQFMFARTCPAPNSLPPAEKNLSAQYPDILYFTTLTKFGQYFVCAGLSGKKAYNLLLLLSIDTGGLVSIAAEVKIDTKFSRL